MKAAVSSQGIDRATPAGVISRSANLGPGETARAYDWTTSSTRKPDTGGKSSRPPDGIVGAGAAATTTQTTVPTATTVAIRRSPVSASSTGTSQMALAASPARAPGDCASGHGQPSGTASSLLTR